LETKLYKEDKIDSRSAKAAALLGMAECLRFGVTSVSDLYYHPEAVADAAAQCGMKANVALSSYRFIADSEDFDFDTDEQCRELCRLKEKWHNYDNGRIKVDAGLYAEYTGNRLLWESVAGYAAEQGLGLQIHLAEGKDEVEDCLDRTGLTPAALLDCHRVFSVPVTAAGCAALEDEDLALLAKRKANAVLTPLSNLKRGMAVPSVRKLAQAGINVALGTDGGVECGNLDMFEVMRGICLAERGTSGDASAMPAPAVLMLGTLCGARTQGRDAQCGMIKVGMDADLVLVDFSAPHLMPCHNVLSGLVFSAKGGDVAMTMVRGNILYKNGQFPTIDLQKVVSELTEYAIGHIFE